MKSSFEILTDVYTIILKASEDVSEMIEVVPHVECNADTVSNILFGRFSSSYKVKEEFREVYAERVQQMKIELTIAKNGYVIEDKHIANISPEYN